MMNQKSIGEFIAKNRKRKGLTQLELAEMLGVSDRTISNWENGVYLPDASLYRLLCDALEISINELFAGEHIIDDRYKKVADENLLRLLEHRLYDVGTKEISFDEFQNSLRRISEFAELLKQYKSKENAVNYLIEETNLSEEECSTAYDIYIKLFE